MSNTKLSYLADFSHSYPQKQQIDSVTLSGGKKTGHKINWVKLLVGENFSQLHIKLVTFHRLNFGF